MKDINKPLKAHLFCIDFWFREEKAFSLIELLVTLIIMSLLISAFMPVVTKKLKSSATVLGGGSGDGGFSSDILFSKECEKFSTEEYKCLMCSTTSCTLCSTQLSTITGYYVDPSEGCEPKNCADKFGSNCMDCKKDSCSACIPGSAFDAETNSCKECEAGYYSLGGLSNCEKCPAGSVSTKGSSGCVSCPSECKSCTTAEMCTECNQGYILNSGKCVLGCNPQTVTLSGTNTKVTRFNMGDDPNCPRDVIQSMSGVIFVPVGTNCPDSRNNKLCCWYGVTAVGNTCTNKGGVYSGCNRTVCMWPAAKKICESIGKGWKLPDTANSMATWYPNNSTASTGLMLCRHAVGRDDSDLCTDAITSCPDADGGCAPSGVWANALSANRNGHEYSWMYFGWDTSKWTGITHAFSVRCVKE